MMASFAGKVAIATGHYAGLTGDRWQQWTPPLQTKLKVKFCLLANSQIKSKTMTAVDQVFRLFQTAKRFGKEFVLSFLLVLSLIVSSTTQPAQAADLTALHPAIHASERFSPIQNTDQLLLYVNAQNLVDTWNNIIIQAKTGDEQRQIMRESGVFANDLKLTFDFDNQKIELNGLDSPEAQEFYTTFVDGLKKNRYNIASNIEAVEFSKDSLRFNSKHWIFFNDRLSVVGENQAMMNRNSDHYQIQAVDMRIVYFDVAHAY